MYLEDPRFAATVMDVYAEALLMRAQLGASMLPYVGPLAGLSAVLVKEASAGVATPWHQDQFYWPLDTDRTITMWMPLVDVPPEIGSMTFVSGSHRLGYLGDYGISHNFVAILVAIAWRHISLLR